MSKVYKTDSKLFFACKNMKRSSVSLLVLMIFVLAYILCICLYTFISGITEEKMHLASLGLSRIKREFLGKIDFWPNNISFNVCCDQDEYLGTNLECVKMTGENKTSVLAQTAVLNEDLMPSYINMQRILYNYRAKEICPQDEMKVITWSTTEPYSYYISQKNGYILELNNDTKIISNYATSSFCLDVNIGQEKLYVALLCPCKEKICVQKCCPKGFYYNTASSSCKKEKQDGVESYKPNFPEGVSYELENKVPKCDGPDKIILDEGEPSPLKMLENGHLMMISTEENGTVDRKKYCVDTFSDGKNNFSYANGFYCPQQSKVKAQRNMIPQNINEQMFSSVSRSCGYFGLIFVNAHFLFLFFVVY